MYKFEFITDWNNIWSHDFQNEWLRWFENSEEPNIFFHPEFVKLWIETYTPIRDIKPIFCVAKDEQNNTIFLPLVLWSKNWKSAFEKVIVPVGYSDYDYSDPIIFGKVNFDIFWEQFFIKIKIFNYNTLIIEGIDSKNIKTNNWQEDQMSPYIEIENLNNIDEFISSLKKNLRQDIKRRTKRLKELGEFNFKVFKKEELTEALEELQIMQNHHSKNWPNAYKAPEYHNNLIRYLLPKGLLHFSTIAIDKKNISWRIGFMYKDKYYSYMPAYEIEYNKFSPGKVHLVYCIEDCIKMNFKIYDQLRGNELYKSEWTKNTKYLKKKIHIKDSFSSNFIQVMLNIKSNLNTLIENKDKKCIDSNS